MPGADGQPSALLFSNAFSHEVHEGDPANKFSFRAKPVDPAADLRQPDRDLPDGLDTASKRRRPTRPSFIYASAALFGLHTKSTRNLDSCFFRSSSLALMGSGY